MSEYILIVEVLFLFQLFNERSFMSGKSRSKRFDEALGKVSDCVSEFEELRDELQNWLDNLPENLQSSNKADMLNEAISELEDIISNLEDVTSRSVEFPGMYG